MLTWALMPMLVWLFQKWLLQTHFVLQFARFVDAADLQLYFYPKETMMASEIILFNGRITTQDSAKPEVSAVAISEGHVQEIGTDSEIMRLDDAATKQIDLENRRVVPGLNDSHLHVIRAGLFSNLELSSGGIAIQHRMAYQGEYFIRRYGVEKAQRLPPIRQMLKMGIPVGAGTDGTRVASYHPWTCLWWMVTGKTVGGTVLLDSEDCMTREEALRLYTHGSAWFSNEDSRKGTLSVGNFADLAVLSNDYFTIEPDAIRSIESVLTMVGGKVVYGNERYATLAPALPPVSPDWSPVAHCGGYNNSQPTPPFHEHTPIMAADGRVWTSSCGCGI